MVLAMSVDHPVLPVGADLQLKGGDIVRLLCFFGNGPLCGDACEDFQNMKVHLLGKRDGLLMRVHFSLLDTHMHPIKTAYSQQIHHFYDVHRIPF